MADLPDPLDWDIPFTTFQNTARYERKIYLCEGLEKRQSHRLVLEPLLPVYNGWRSDGSASSSEEEIVPPTFHVYEGVSNSFAPAGGDPSVSFRVNKEGATTPAVQEMVLTTEEGVEILRVRPKFRQRRRVLRGCVELAISEWMKWQRELPLGDPRRHNVQSEVRSYNINGEVKQVAVWLWRGLEQDVQDPSVFRVFL